MGYLRKIKFRGKRVDNGNWVYGSYTYHLCRHSILINSADEFDNHPQVIPETIGQFTGLKDKNGQEIYEGDILKYYQPYSKKWKIHIVLWDEKFSCFGLFENNDEWCKESDWLKIKDLEVVGNIHETKDV